MFKKVFFLLVFASTTFFLQAQTAEEIIDNYFENTGGIDKWKKLQSQQINGKMFQGPMEFEGTVTVAVPNKQKVEVNVAGTTIIQAYDGTTAWMLNPLQGGMTAQKMPDEMAQQMINQEFPSEFFNYKEKGHEVVLEGTEDIEGTECFKIKLTKKNGSVQYTYFDTEYYIPVMVRAVVSSGTSTGQNVDTYMSEYKEVEGLVMAHSIETKSNGVSMMKIIVSEIKINPQIPANFFDFPGGAKEKVEKVEIEEAPPVRARKDGKADQKSVKKIKKEKN